MRDPQANGKRRGFFEFVFGNTTGYLCIASRDPRSGDFEETFFKYPQQLDQVIEGINQVEGRRDLYYCPHLLAKKRRVKENVLTTPAAWADLDECHPDALKVRPTLVIESSPGKYQGLWKFVSPVPAPAGEDISKRIAYYHESDGCDLSGWDLTQLLRVPLTRNLKYDNPAYVQVRNANPDLKYEEHDFDVYPAVAQERNTTGEEIPFPDEFPFQTAEEVLEHHKLNLNPKVWDLFEQEPTSDWSKSLWELELMLFESGLEAPEVFLVVEEAACNKFRRDGKPKSALWKEVVRAYTYHEQKNSPFTIQPLPETPSARPLLTPEERRQVESEQTFVEEYIEWAKGLGDAAWQYHQAGAFIALSTLLSSYVKLPTSFGNLRMNMWFMILADTTLTRKTTAMDLAMDLVREVDPDCILATDGSIEGLLQSLSYRPGRASVFLRDEFTGLIEMMGKKDYYAGMMESLTKLYDGKYQKRVLKKEIIEVKDPLLVIFAGGIRDRMESLMDYEHVASGFLPRFVFITAESDVTRLKPLGPPTAAVTEGREKLVDRLSHLFEHYKEQTAPRREDGKTFLGGPVNAELTGDAWVLYNRMETSMLESALTSPIKDTITPMMARLSISGLKAATLLRAINEPSGDRVVVTEDDIIRAFYYVEQWREYALDILGNIGKTARETTLQRLAKTVERTPGVLRSQLMQNYHLSAREADAIFATLEQRGLLRRQKSGRGERLYPIGGIKS